VVVLVYNSAYLKAIIDYFACHFGKVLYLYPCCMGCMPWVPPHQLVQEPPEVATAATPYRIIDNDPSATANTRVISDQVDPATFVGIDPPLDIVWPYGGLTTSVAANALWLTLKRKVLTPAEAAIFYCTSSVWRDRFVIENLQEFVQEGVATVQPVDDVRD
jgi:hypothetical protein